MYERCDKLHTPKQILLQLVDGSRAKDTPQRPAALLWNLEKAPKHQGMSLSKHYLLHIKQTRPKSKNTHLQDNLVAPLWECWSPSGNHRDKSCKNESYRSKKIRQRNNNSGICTQGNLYRVWGTFEPELHRCSLRKQARKDHIRRSCRHRI